MQQKALEVHTLLYLFAENLSYQIPRYSQPTKYKLLFGGSLPSDFVVQSSQGEYIMLYFTEPVGRVA